MVAAGASGTHCLIHGVVLILDKVAQTLSKVHNLRLTKVGVDINYIHTLPGNDSFQIN